MAPVELVPLKTHGSRSLGGHQAGLSSSPEAEVPH